MSAGAIKPALWLFVIGYTCLQSPTTSAQDKSAKPVPTSLKEFRDNGSLYFPPSAFKMPDGSSDGWGDSLAWYLRGLGEPPITSVDNPQAHAYRLILIGFPSAKVLVLRLTLGNDGTAKMFAKEARLDDTNLLINKEQGISVAAVNGFLECVKRGDFWQLATREQTEPQVLDGSYWYLEGARHGEYHLVYRRAPEVHPSSFTDIGRYLAKDLAQLDDSVIRIPTGTNLARAQDVVPSQGTLAYPATRSSEVDAFLLRSPRGIIYRLSLVPDVDIGKHVVVLELVLEKGDEGKSGPNLLDPTGKLHGYQPYDFAASDFARGARGSIYGDSRTIDLHELGMKVDVKIAAVKVKPIGSSSSKGNEYEFEELALQVSTQRLVEAASKNR